MLRTLLSRCMFGLVLFLGLSLPVYAASASYTVQGGDSLYSIARRTHVSVAQLQLLNHLPDANYLREGQKLALAPTQLSPRHTRTIAASKRVHSAHTRPPNKHVAWTARVHHARTSLVRTLAPQNNARTMATTEAVWMATHGGSVLPSFSLSPAYQAAQRTLAFELRLTRTAMRFLGVPYAWGGTSFSGVDCSGFVQAVFHRNGIDLPRTADAQFEVGQPIRERNLEPGDLVFFQTYSAGASHVGIYVGAGRFVHASSSEGVRVDSLSEDYYASRYIGARRTAAI